MTCELFRSFSSHISNIQCSNDVNSVTISVPFTIMKRYKSFNAAQFDYFEAANRPNGIEEINERVPFLAGDVVGNPVIELDDAEDVVPDSDERSMEF